MYFSTIQRMLNTPQISFADTNVHPHTTNPQISLSEHQNWDHTLENFNNEQKVISGNQGINQVNTPASSADLSNMITRGDTLDRIPVFVNPHDLNQTNHTHHGNQETQDNNTFNSRPSNFGEYQNVNHENTSPHIVHPVQESEQQSQIKLANTSTPQVFNIFLLYIGYL